MIELKNLPSLGDYYLLENEKFDTKQFFQSLLLDIYFRPELSRLGELIKMNNLQEFSSSILWRKTFDERIKKTKKLLHHKRDLDEFFRINYSNESFNNCYNYYNEENKNLKINDAGRKWRTEDIDRIWEYYEKYLEGLKNSSLHKELLREIMPSDYYDCINNLDYEDDEISSKMEIFLKLFPSLSNDRGTIRIFELFIKAFLESDIQIYNREFRDKYNFENLDVKVYANINRERRIPANEISYLGTKNTVLANPQKENSRMNEALIPGRTMTEGFSRIMIEISSLDMVVFDKMKDKKWFRYSKILPSVCGVYYICAPGRRMKELFSLISPCQFQPFLKVNIKYKKFTLDSSSLGKADILSGRMN